MILFLASNALNNAKDEVSTISLGILVGITANAAEKATQSENKSLKIEWST